MEKHESMFILSLTDMACCFMEIMPCSSRVLLCKIGTDLANLALVSGPCRNLLRDHNDTYGSFCLLHEASGDNC